MILSKLQRRRLKADKEEARRIRQEIRDWYLREKAKLAQAV